MAEFEFDQQLEYQNSVEIENLGDFGLEAINDEGEMYYLAAKTFLGFTVLASCGPIIPDVDTLPSGYSCNLTKLSYREDKLAKTISFWLNDKSKGVKYVNILDYESAVKEFRDLSNYLLTIDEENF